MSKSLPTNREILLKLAEDMSGVKDRLDSVESRLDSMENRLGSLEEKVDKHFKYFQNEFSVAAETFNYLTNEIAKISGLEENQHRMEKKLDKVIEILLDIHQDRFIVNKRLDSIEAVVGL